MQTIFSRRQDSRRGRERKEGDRDGERLQKRDDKNTGRESDRVLGN